MNTAMPIGIDDFKKVREQYYFVDKTDFIRQLIDNHSAVTLITRPRRFGKTLTMSMLEYFFSIDLKEKSTDLFSGLIIEKSGNAYMKYRGSRPVVSISLKNSYFVVLCWDFWHTCRAFPSLFYASTGFWA